MCMWTPSPSPLNLSNIQLHKFPIFSFIRIPPTTPHQSRKPDPCQQFLACSCIELGTIFSVKGGDISRKIINPKNFVFWPFCLACQITSKPWEHQVCRRGRMNEFCSCYTFHFHDSIVRNVLRFVFCLSLNPGFIVLLRGNYNYCLSGHALERSNLPLLCIRIYICL